MRIIGSIMMLSLSWCSALVQSRGGPSRPLHKFMSTLHRRRHSPEAPCTSPRSLLVVKSAAPIDSAMSEVGKGLQTKGGGGSGCAPALAQLVGVAVTVGSFTLKVPQITKCISASSVAGLSLYGAYFELNNYLGSAIYHYLQGYPLSTWAENLSLVAQQTVLIAMLWKLSSPAPSLAHMATFLVAETLYIGGSLRLPKRAWPFLIASNGALNIFANAAQLWLTFTSKSVGQLSWITLALSLGGNLARLFTTLVLARGDRFLLLLSAIAALLNGMRAFQFSIYS